MAGVLKNVVRSGVHSNTFCFAVQFVLVKNSSFHVNEKKRTNIPEDLRKSRSESQKGRVSTDVASIWDRDLSIAIYSFCFIFLTGYRLKVCNAYSVIHTAVHSCCSRSRCGKLFCYMDNSGHEKICTNHRWWQSTINHILHVPWVKRLFRELATKFKETEMLRVEENRAIDSCLGIQVFQ